MTGFKLSAELDISDSKKERDSLLQWVDGLEKSAPAEFELDTSTPTQVSLQLLIALDRHLKNLGFTTQPGPNASAWLAAEAPFEGV